MTQRLTVPCAYTVYLTLGEAARVFLDELAQVDAALGAAGFEGTSDALARALGLALQLGPSATELALRRIFRAVGILPALDGPARLSTLAPALVSVVDGVREAGAFPPTPVMEAWAMLAADWGAAIAEVGLALAPGSEQRRAMVAACRLRAALLDEGPGGVLELSEWIGDIFPVE